MALIVPGPLVGDISGSVGGTTFARNAGGLYARRRTVPVNPSSTYQGTVRSALSSLVARWYTILTAAQREAWANYAAAVQLPNALGFLHNVPPLSHYIRSNVPRIQADNAAIDVVDDAPTTFGLASFNDPTPGVPSEATQNFTLDFVETDQWLDHTGACMLIYVSRPQNQTVNYFKGPYRYRQIVLGDDTTPPSSPVTVSAPFPFAAGQRLFIRVMVSREDGRLSTPFRTYATCGA